VTPSLEKYNKVDRYVCSGAILTDIERRVNQLDLTQYKHVIIFVGGNDFSSEKRPDALHAKLFELTRSIQHHKCKVHLCTISPRLDADVTSFNKNVRDICIKTGA
jgi:lysophospholipase L1-like esterase